MGYTFVEKIIRGWILIGFVSILSFALCVLIPSEQMAWIGILGGTFFLFGALIIIAILYDETIKRQRKRLR